MAIFMTAKAMETEYKELVASYEKSIKELNVELNKAHARIEQLQNSLTVFVTDEHVKKEILKLYARANSSLEIFRILNETKGMSVQFKEIEDIITNLKNGDLPTEDMAYFNEESKAFADNMANFEEDYRIKQIRKLMENQDILDRFTKRVEEQGLDEDELRKIRDLTSLMKESRENVKALSGIMKNTSGSQIGGGLENPSRELSKETQEENMNILKNFDPTKLVTVN